MPTLGLNVNADPVPDICRTQPFTNTQNFIVLHPNKHTKRPQFLVPDVFIDMLHYNIVKYWYLNCSHFL